jgi:polyisoprenoid-binding protein YceI
MRTRISRCLTVAIFAGTLGGPALLAADTFKADNVHSSVIFRIKHLNVSYCYGRFNELSGTFSFDDAKPEQSKFEFEVKVDSIDTADAKRDAHLKKAELFDAATYPTITFKSTAVKKTGENTFDVSGELTLRGTTRPIAIKLERVGAGADAWGGYRCGFESVFTIKRSDFGMTGLKDGLGDEVRLIVSVEGVRQ